MNIEISGHTLQALDEYRTAYIAYIRASEDGRVDELPNLRRVYENAAENVAMALNSNVFPVPSLNSLASGREPVPKF